MKQSNDLMTRSEFARLVGCARQSVMYAERRGMFTKGVKYREGQTLFDAKAAVREWATYIDPTPKNEALAVRLHKLAGFDLKPLSADELKAMAADEFTVISSEELEAMIEALCKELRELGVI